MSYPHIKDTARRIAGIRGWGCALHEMPQDVRESVLDAASAPLARRMMSRGYSAADTAEAVQGALWADQGLQ